MSQRRTISGRFSVDDNETTAVVSTSMKQPDSVGVGTNGVFEITDGTTLSLDDSNIVDDDIENGQQQLYQESQPLSSSLPNDNNVINNGQHTNVNSHRMSAAERHTNRIRYWKESPFAVGLTEPTWVEERNRSTQLEEDISGCLWCSAYVCPLLGASRVGNMAVLKSSAITVEVLSDDVDETTGQQLTERIKKPQLDIVVGPYWPMLVFVTYPLIFGVSGLTLKAIYENGLPVIGIVIWLLCTVGLIVSLALTSCRDPGIVHRMRTIPKTTNQQPNKNSNNGYPTAWRWTDQADSYRPRGAWYDTDTAVVVEGFDHT
jgi:hypothetical protein